MSNEMMKMARQHRCAGCGWFHRSQSVVPGEVHAYGKCVVDAPRTGARGAWPMVTASDYCGEFSPIANLEVVS